MTTLLTYSARGALGAAVAFMVLLLFALPPDGAYLAIFYGLFVAMAFAFLGAIVGLLLFQFSEFLGKTPRALVRVFIGLAIGLVAFFVILISSGNDGYRNNAFEGIVYFGIAGGFSGFMARAEKR